MCCIEFVKEIELVSSTLNPNVVSNTFINFTEINLIYLLRVHKISDSVIVIKLWFLVLYVFLMYEIFFFSFISPFAICSIDPYIFTVPNIVKSFIFTFLFLLFSFIYPFQISSQFSCFVLRKEKRTVPFNKSLRSVNTTRYIRLPRDTRLDLNKK